MMRMNQAAVLAVEAEVGPVEYLDVTEFGDFERMYLVTSPKCSYCGCINPSERCVKCGASAVPYPAYRP